MTPLDKQNIGIAGFPICISRVVLLPPNQSNLSAKKVEMRSVNIYSTSNIIVKPYPILNPPVPCLNPQRTKEKTKGWHYNNHMSYVVLLHDLVDHQQQQHKSFLIRDAWFKV